MYMYENSNVYNKSIRQMILNNSLIDKKTYLLGSYNGFNIKIKLLLSEPQINVVINANSESDINNEQLSIWLQSNVNNLIDIQNIEVTNNSILLAIKRPFIGKKVPDIINHNINYIVNYLISGGYTTCCDECGTKNKNINLYQVNSNYGYFCDNCIVSIKNKLNEHKSQKQNNQPNMINGIIGAILGSLLGILTWIIIYKLGFIASLGGFVIAYCTLFGFEKFGKSIDKKSIITCIIIIISTVWIANKLAWTLEAYSSLELYYSFFECFTNLNQLLSVNNLTTAYYTELIIGYILTALGSYKIIKQTLFNSGGNYILDKIEK